MVVYTNSLHASLRDKMWFMVMFESTHPLGRWKNTLNHSMSWKKKKKKKPYIKKAIKTTPNSSNGIQLKWIDLWSTVSVFILKPLLPRGTSVSRCHEAWDRCEKELWRYPFMFDILWQHALMNTSQPNKAPHFQNSHTHSIRHVKMYSWWL
jgi:hypothetical protein